MLSPNSGSSRGYKLNDISARIYGIRNSWPRKKLPVLPVAYAVIEKAGPNDPAFVLWKRIDYFKT